MPVAHQPVQVSISDVLQVRAGALSEQELWSVLCQSAEAVQDVFIKNEAVCDGLPSFVISPYTLLLCPSGRIQFAETVDTSRPDIRNYLPPEVLTPSNTAIEKLYVYSLGTTIYHAAQYGQTTPNLSHSLNAILMAMCDRNAASRVPLMTVLEACSLHAQSGHTGLPYSHNVIKLSKTVLGSVYELDKLFATSPGMGIDDNDAANGNSLPNTSNRQQHSMPSEHTHNSGRISPGKRQLRNGHDSYSQKRPRSNRSRHDRENYAADADNVRPRSRSLNRNSSNSTRQHRDTRYLSTSTLDTSHGSSEDLRHNTRHSSHRQNGSTRSDDPRSYHMSDIFSPSVASRLNTVHTANDTSSQRSRSPHVRDNSGKPPPSPRSRKSSRSPPGGDSRRSRASLVYERLRERRDRLSLLREQLGLRDVSDRGPLRPKPNFYSDSETFSDDGSDLEVPPEKSDGRYRSAKSLNSGSSAQEGSYYPDQYPHYASAGTLPAEDDEPAEDMEYHGNERPDLRPNPSVDPVHSRPRNMPPPNQPAKQRQNGATLNNKKPKKLKKFFGPEFAVMSSKPNEKLDIQPSLMCKSGKIPTDRKLVTIVLLNGRRLDLMCDLGTLGHEMYDMVVAHMGVQETYYFGLAYIKDGEYLFLDPDEKLYKVGPESWKDEVKKGSKKVNARDKFTLFFRVKFYIENTTILRDPLSRHQYYLQLRKDILEERTTCDQQVALQLASLALQAEMGDYYADSMGQNYFLPEHYVPTAAIDMLGVPAVRQRVPPMHEMHQGMDELQAELEFLMEARKLPEYGIHFHRMTRAKKDARTSIWYGICTRGLILYEKRGNTRVQVHAHPWHLTRKIAFNRKKFSIEPNDGSHHKILHYTDNYKKGRYLLKMCQAQHKFQMAMRSKAMASQQFYGDFGTTPHQFDRESQNYPSKYSAPDDSYPTKYSTPDDSYPTKYNAQDQVDADFSDFGESYPNSARSSFYHDDHSLSRSTPSINGLYNDTPKINGRSGPASRGTASPVYDEPPREYQPRPHENRRPKLELPTTRASRPTEPRSHSMDRTPHVEPGYASIGEVMRSKSEERSSAPMQDSRRYQAAENGYHDDSDDRHDQEPEKPYHEAAPYVIDASIRTHERTEYPHPSEDNNDIISETLRERLEELPAPEQPEREINIINLHKDNRFGLGFTIVGGENSRSMDLGIFVQSVATNGPAEQDGRLQPGDRIISINGQSLEGVSHRIAVDILRGTEGAVQLIVSQPKSSSPVPRQTPHEGIGDVLYAKVNKPAHSRIGLLSKSEQNIDNNTRSRSGSTSSVERRKSTPPRKPKRLPGSFGGSNVSLNDAGQGTPIHVPRIVKNRRYLDVDGVDSERTRDNDDVDDDDGEDSDLHAQRNGHQKPSQNGRQEQYQNGHQSHENKDFTPRSTQENNIRIDGGHLDDTFSANDDEGDIGSDSESEVPTPESSDIDDLFPDENEGKPRINLRRALVSPSSDAPPSAYESQNETGRESIMSATDTERGQAGGPVDARGVSEFKPGDRFHVNLQKKGGSLGISVTGGVNTSVKHGGIYIKSMVPSGVAALDGRIQIGDRVLDVNGESLIGVTHKQAVETLRRAPEYSTLIIEHGLPPPKSNTLPPTPAPSPLVGINDNGEPVIMRRNQEMQESEVPTTTSSDVVTSPERTTASTARTSTTTDPSQMISTGEQPENMPTTTSHDSNSSTPLPTSNIASPTTVSNVASPITTSSIPSPVAASNTSSPITTSDGPSPTTTSNVASPITVVSPDTATSEDDFKERRTSLISAFSEHSIPPLPEGRRLSQASIRSDQTTHLAKERRISEVSTVSQQSLPLPSDINFSDSDSDIPLPSETSNHSRQLTPTIEALQEDFEDDESISSSVPQSDAEYDDRESMLSVPQSDHDESVIESEDLSDSIESSEDEDEDEEDSDVPDMFDPRFASPALSTREADTLTPTAHLFGTGTPTHGRFGMRTPNRNLVDGRPSPLPESASESWLDSPPHSPPPPPPDSPPSSPPPAPPQPPPQTVPTEAPSPSVVPSQSPSVQSVPSDIQRSTSAQSQQNPDLRLRLPSSPGFSDYDAPSPVPSFGSFDESLPLPSGQSSRSVTPDLGSTLGSLGAMTLSQTGFGSTAFGSTMGLDSEIELPDLSYVHPENTFEVQLTKGTSGLGFSIQGGKGLHRDPKMCLIRVKKLFPGSPAYLSDMMDEGDVILAVNDVPVHSLNHDEAVSVLRGTPKEVRLLLCRPSEEELEELTLQHEEKEMIRRQHTKETATITTPSLSPRNSLNKTGPGTPFTPPFTPEVFPSPPKPTDDEISWPPSSPDLSLRDEAPMTKKSAIPLRSTMTPSPADLSSRSFLSVNEQEADIMEITLIKPSRGGFGFTVAGGANSGGCYIKDILHDPALSDGRLKKGDKLLSVNDTDLKGMSHFDAVSFLRMAPQEVTLRLCRNTPGRLDNIASPSPPHTPVGLKMDSTPSSRSNTPSVLTQDLPIIKIERNHAGHLGMSVTLDLKSRKQGIYVGDLTPGLPAEIEGSVAKGDLVHTINGRSLSGVGLLEARRVLDQAVPIVKLQLTRDGQPVHPVRRSNQSSPASTVASSIRPQTPHSSSSTAPSPSPSNPPLPRSPPPASPPPAIVKTTAPNELEKQRTFTKSELDEAVKPKTSGLEDLGFDLGDVSADESWEDFSSDPEDDDPGNSMDDVEAILAALDQGTNVKKDSKDEKQIPKVDTSAKPIKEDTLSSNPQTPASSIPHNTTTPSSSSVPQTTTSSSVPPTPSSSSAPQTPSKTSGEDDYEGTSHYSTPSNPYTSSSEDDALKGSTGQPGVAPPLTPISENESFAFTPYKTPKEQMSEPDSPIDFGTSPLSFMSSTPSPAPTEDNKTNQESPIFSDSPIDELLQTPTEIKPTSLADRFSTPVGSQSSGTPVRFQDTSTPAGRRSTPLDMRGTPPVNRYTPGIESEREPTETTSEGGVMWIDLQKSTTGSLGFSLTGGMKGGKTTILVKTITPGGAAEADGRLKVGDRILQVNGQSFVGMTQNKAVGVLRKCKGKVTLAIARNMSRSASQADLSQRPKQPDTAADKRSGNKSARDEESEKPKDSKPDLSNNTTEEFATALSDPAASTNTDLGAGSCSTTASMSFVAGGGSSSSSKDLALEHEHVDLPSDSVTFDSSESLPIRPHSSALVCTPPVEFSCGFKSGHDTDSDLDDTMDLPKDTPVTLPGGLKISRKMGQKVEESDESSCSWGSDTDLPLSMDGGDGVGGSLDPTPRGTPSNKILSVISDAELRRMAVLRPSKDGKYSGRQLRNIIATLQKQIDKQDPVEEYKELRQDISSGTCDEANKPANKDKNRYRNVLPYDKTRVVIQDGVMSNYINASHIQVHVGKDTHHYIASQGPLPNTTADFWQMVWEQRADVIAMVTLDIENGKVKCHRYWPDNMEEPMTIGNRFQLRLDNLQTLENFDIRKISMTDTHTNQIHYVTHLNFTTWPDHGVPSTALPLLRYARYMRRIHTNGPIVVHCSAGIGRTGTLITIDTIIGLIDRDEPFKIRNIVKDVRSQRQGMIQTKDQYAFCYRAVMEALKTLL